MSHDDSATNALYAEIDRLTSEAAAQLEEDLRLQEVRFRRLDNMRDAMERAREVARVHPHADTCATELSPNAGYPCSCWRGDLIIALTMPTESEAI
jgi:hypothetical protein